MAVNKIMYLNCLQYVVSVILLPSVTTIILDGFEFPPYEVKAYKPKGLKISIPDSPGITKFEANIVNTPEEFFETGQQANGTVSKVGNRWVFEDENIRLHPGDTLYFWLVVDVNKRVHTLGNLEYIVQKLLDKKEEVAPTISIPVKKCEKGRTTVFGKQSCKGDIILLDDFNDGRYLDSNWTTEVQIPKAGESYFVVLDKKNRIVNNGTLEIKPSLTEENRDRNFIRTGYLQLDRCTAESRQNCEANGFSWNIIPPILTSRIHTKYSFNFKYGTIEVRAKLPKGDWIVPEIWLVGKDSAQNSGKIIIARSFGNDDLTLYDNKIGSNLLSQGVSTNETNLILYYKMNDQQWTNDFHTYKVEWTQGNIIFKVDDAETGRLVRFGQSFYSLFDREFYVSVGVHVGGLVDFPEESLNKGKPKPWSDPELRNTINFWMDKENWYKTWNDDSKLVIDYIKVTAI